ncbi:hypothetical protein K3172_05515 [Qipengyuania sp. 6B39]|uniref:hypothetical protein n=1 Tax=Qipengyuania proteolytica TaxID=2867239 RepID=UPI001C8A6684|nr:hypothetical protein [Qipengyuania proteolytica]MBX7495310.1 hypothetical protein [Qipengyuania proteolytica]
MRALLVSAAVLALAACNGAAPDDGEVSEEAAAIAENGPVIGTRSGEAVDYDEEGRRWFYKPSTRTALFGTEESEGVVSLSCNGSMTGEETLVFQWIEAAPVDATGALSISSGGNTASVELKGVASALGPDAFWEGEISQRSEAYALLAGTAQPITLSLGEKSLTVPKAQPLATVLETCLPG